MSTAVADPSARGVRDAAVIAILCGIGLSPAEISRLDYADFDYGGGRLRLPRAAAEHWLRLAEDIARPIAAWVVLRGANPGPLLHPISRPDRILPRRFSKVIVAEILARRAREAAVPLFSPDDRVRTRTLACSGQWKANCCCLLPPEGGSFFEMGSGVATHQRSLADLSNCDRQPTRTSPIIRYLSHLIPNQRSTTHELLGALAELLGGADPITFPWERLTTADLPMFEELRFRFGRRGLSQAKRSLNGVLRDAVYLRAMPQIEYERIRDASWNKISRKRGEIDVNLTRNSRKIGNT
jgi:hypothetical protein